MSGLISYIFNDDDPTMADWTNDVDTGTDGNDTMHGGDYWGVELHGGAGDDLYYLAFGATGNAIYDSSGHDRIEAYFEVGDEYTMPEGIEDLSVECVWNGWGPWLETDWTNGAKDADYDTTAGVTIIGNGLNNVIRASDMADLVQGGAGNDALFGNAGADTLQGGTGHDDLHGDTGNDLLQGDAGDDELKGGDGADQLQGGSGNDSFDGGAGADTMVGGTGDDLYYLDSSADVIRENTFDLGIDTVVVRHADTYDLSAIPGIENLIFSVLNGNTAFASYSAYGSELSNKIVGHYNSANYVEARGGFDHVETGWRSDTVRGGDGNDTVLADGSDDLVFGEVGHDSLHGGSGNDWLDGGTGNDRLDGAENNDVLIGGQGADSIQGGSGNDSLSGGTEADRLEGGTGRDTIQGGAGADQMWGGADLDSFRFTSAADSTTANRDVIMDFQEAEWRYTTTGTAVWVVGDKLDLSGIDANATVAGNQAFAWTGTGAFFKSAGDLWIAAYDQGTYVRGDTNGDAIADFEVYLLGVTGLTAADIVL
jgi:Ca2+-binding RTX toxin-like protein